MKRANATILHGSRATNAFSDGLALDVRQYRTYCAGLENLAREARLTEDPRVMRAALECFATQTQNIERLTLAPLLLPPAARKRRQDRELEMAGTAREGCAR